MSESWFHKAKKLEEVTHKCNLCDIWVEDCSDCGMDFNKNEEMICVDVTCQGQYETQEDKGSAHFCKECALKYPEGKELFSKTETRNQK